MANYLADHRLFWRLYTELSEEGLCDLPGSAEYFRVYEAWCEAGRPPWIGNFIFTHANDPAPNPPPERR